MRAFSFEGIIVSEMMASKSDRECSKKNRRLSPQSVMAGFILQ